VCGRYMMTSSPDAIRRLFRYAERPNFPPRDEICPGEPIAVVIASAAARHFRLMRWGFLPVWAKDPREFKPLINARLETAPDKPAFRGAMRHGRCLIPADGFFEWSGARGSRRQRHTITPAEGAPIAFAGLWGNWAHADGSEIDGACILTCTAAPEIAAVHDRMPVTVPSSLFDLWLDAAFSAEKAATALAKAPPPRWTVTPPAVAPAAPRRPATQLDLF
jgi:putative SOS response-associated peptidase YedK